jgi:NAD(P)-dependent dehydrogenase (short-subunit alcohol dehydrogenase family)
MTDSERLCEGRVVVVTGAGRGIGREHALMLANHGAKVVVNDLGAARDGSGGESGPAQEVVEEIKGSGGEAVANADDISDFEGAGRLIQSAIDSFGTLDAVVNNAGILRDRMSFNMSEEDWDVVINVVLKGAFAPSRFAASYWREQAKATGEPVNAAILNTASESGVYGNAGQVNYSAAKMGITGMTITMARDLERIGVRVNAITPGAATRLLGTVMPQGTPEPDPDAYNPMAAAHIAPLVAWLCSDLAAGVSAQVFSVSGMRIQLLQGWHPITQIDGEGEPWSIDRIESLRKDLLADHPTGIPPFMPPVS